MADVKTKETIDYNWRLNATKQPNKQLIKYMSSWWLPMSTYHIGVDCTASKRVL